MIDTVKEMEAAGMLEDSESSWSSQVVLVKKKDNTKRMAIDYRRLRVHHSHHRAHTATRGHVCSSAGRSYLQ